MTDLTTWITRRRFLVMEDKIKMLQDFADRTGILED